MEQLKGVGLTRKDKTMLERPDWDKHKIITAIKSFIEIFTTVIYNVCP